jgi:hypothetical protein
METVKPRRKKARTYKAAGIPHRRRKRKSYPRTVALKFGKNITTS